MGPADCQPAARAIDQAHAALSVLRSADLKAHAWRIDFIAYELESALRELRELAADLPALTRKDPS